MGIRTEHLHRPAQASGSTSMAEVLETFAGEFDRQLESYLASNGETPDQLLEAVRYSALAPGKRIRPYLVVRCCELVGGLRADAWPVAAAVECVHAFSLIHDDLPAMDNDDLRRGKPTNHKKFGEALAILAGDALVVLAFELLTRRIPDGVRAEDLVMELCRGVGWAGMIGGQAADILGQNKPPALEHAEYIHDRKTASLFSSSCRLGGLLGKGTPAQVADLGQFGLRLGRAFQIADDLLDVTSTPAAVGKGVGKDTRARKQTFLQCVGIEESRAAARNTMLKSVSALEEFGQSADDLRALAQHVIDRNY